MSLPFDARIRPELFRRQMIEAFNDARPAECFRYHLGRDYASQFLPLRRRKIKGIHGVDKDLPVPILGNLRDILRAGKLQLPFRAKS
ncbi:MAG: hypothetical protein WBX22_24870 [Silvibacterium sp.]